MVKHEKESLQSERDHLLGKTESLLTDYEQEKKVCYVISVCVCTLLTAVLYVQLFCCISSGEVLYNGD